MSCRLGVLSSSIFNFGAMCNLVPRVSGFLVSGATPAHYMQKAKTSVMTTIIMGSSHLLPSVAFLIILFVTNV